MQALILAAGRGSRLGETAGGACKCLLEVGRKPLFEHQLDSLSAAGVGPIGMVVGYAAHEVEEAVGKRAEYIHNTRWRATNSLYSFWLARDWIRGECLVLNSDILFDPGVLDRLLEGEGDALVYDSGSGEGREQMSVHSRDGLLADMRKDMPADLVTGENVGMLRLSLDTCSLLFAKAEELIAQGREKDWLGSALREIARERPIRTIDIHGLPWGEVDFPHDLQTLRREVWPSIERRRRRARPSRRLGRWAASLALAALIAVPTVRGWARPHEIAWDSLELQGLKSATLTSVGRHRTWWLLPEDAAGQATVEGPTLLRLDARPLVSADADETTRYVLEIALDGRVLEWRSLAGRGSDSWRFGEEAVGKRERIEIEVPGGIHTLRTRLVATTSEPCLVRLRQSSEDG